MGTTTTGSIDAKLTVDDSDFKRGMTEAKAEAKEVGALEPTVKVDANVGPALAKLEAVQKAERDLDIAFQRSTIAQEKLDVVTKKYGEDSAQAASARLALTRATNAESDAQAKHAGLLARDTEEQDKNTESTKAGVHANRDRVSGLQVLLALAPGILAAAAPIAGAATGLAVGFGVMGLSGVLAFKGIKDAMEVGDSVGNTYAVGLQGIKGDLNALAGTSANAMLASFNDMVGDINSRMPFLTQMIGQGSIALGQMGGTALRGVLDGLRTMNPLLQMGEAELGKFVTWLFSFNGTSGFNDFIVYSMDNLPSVMHLLENLVITGGHILSAFAPLGPVMLTLLNGLTDGLNALPLPVLAGLVTTATLLGPALRMAFAPGVSTLIIAVAEAIGYTGVMANLAVPVVGILTAAIAGIGVMAATSALGTSKGTEALRDYTQALKDDNLAIGDHVKAQVAKELVDTGAAEAAQRLGLSLMTVQQAAIGNKTAIEAVKNVTDDASKKIIDWTSGGAYASEQNKRLSADVDLMRNSVLGASGAVQEQLDKQKLLNEMLRPTTEAVQGQTSALGMQATAFGTTVQALQAAKDAQDKNAQSTADATLKMQLENDAAGLLKMTLDGLNGKAISAAQAQNAFDSSLANMGTHVDKTGKQITFTTSSINDMSAASVALRGQLNTQVSQLMAVVEANGGLSNSTAEAKGQMAAMRQQIIDNAVAHGVDKTAVEQYIDKLLQVPKSVPPTKLDVDTSAAEAALQALTRRRTVEITAITTQVRGGGSPDDPSMTALNPAQRADGGEVLYRAGGGGVPFRPSGTDTVPAMLTPGEVVMKRSSVDSLGLGNLLQANRTGSWPEQNSGPVNVMVMIGGEAVDSRFVQIVHQELDGVARQIGGMRR
ncbi:hypothetical protein [Pseudarthrobacter sp. NIBRBAC000502771]|uniref:hypothetical protein n=1 Tax=Pseudarthrobacter sp. NIBRBAC000502771 TaxID=2590774 RepID=UPI00113159C9|nr:hypothetical protein [Pseudarthrobacter sp. NIBRBAC000502771]QDG61245.1 hypothetical protein NIBR502771_02260 [Pseudarthrobacter sp. NIBRBAC000502771]